MRGIPLLGATMFVLGAMSAGRLLVAQVISETPSFEVVSIRRTTNASPTGPLHVTTAGQLVGRMNLRGIIVLAYGVEGGERIVAANPAHSSDLDEQYEVWAKPPAAAFPPRRDEVQAMTRRMLAERFALKLRIDTELAETTVLRLAKPGVLGPGLRPAPEGCTKLPQDVSPYDDKYAEAYQRSCTLTYFNDHVRGTLTLSDFVRSLSAYARRRFLDRTELRGLFTIDVKMSRASLLPLGAVPQSSAPAFVDAVRDQLGLDARTERHPVRVFIVEHLEPLVEN